MRRPSYSRRNRRNFGNYTGKRRGGRDHRSILFSVGTYLAVVLVLAVGAPLIYHAPSYEPPPVIAPEESTTNPPGEETPPADETIPQPQEDLPKEPVIRAPAQEEMIDPAFFSDAVFIGDSLSEGLLVYGVLDTDQVFAEKGMTTKKARSYFDKIAAKNPKKVYVLLGINDLTDYYQDVDTLVVRYRDFLYELVAAVPDAQVYVESVFPLAKKYNNSKTKLTNDKIYWYNVGLQNACLETGAKYIDINSSLKGEDGYMIADLTGDGLHLKGAYYGFWMNLLMENS